MSEELLKIADGLLAVSEGVRALAGKAHSCNCSKNQEEERGQKDEESGNEKSQEKQENAVTIEQVRAVMASKSQDGKTQQVKALIQKYGADKLSGVQPEKYADTISKVISKGSTPAGMHISIMVKEILDFLDIKPGQQGLDATLGYLSLIHI